MTEPILPRDPGQPWPRRDDRRLDDLHVLPQRTTADALDDLTAELRTANLLLAARFIGSTDAEEAALMRLGLRDRS